MARLTLCILEGLSTEARVVEVDARNIAEALSIAGVSPDLATVRVGGIIIPCEWWPRVRPTPQTPVVVDIRPAGGGALRSILSIGVAISAAIAAPFVLGGLAAGGVIPAAWVSSTIAINATTAVLGGAAFLAFTALVPPPDMGLASRRKESRAWHAREPRQSLAPLGPEPVVLGRVKYAPPYAAEPILVPAGDKSRILAAVVWSAGKVALEDIRVGSTKLEDLPSIAHVFYQAGTTPPALQFLTGDVTTQRPGIVLSVGSPVTVTTATATRKATVVISWPRGLFRISSSTGDVLDGRARIKIEWRSGDGNFSLAVDTTVQARSTAEYIRGFDVQFPSAGIYDVRVTLVELRSEARENSVVLAALQSWQDNASPIVPAGVSVSEFSIEGAEDLTGIADSISAIVTSIVPDWDKTTSTWVERATSNPSSIALAILRGLGSEIAADEETIDHEAFTEWHEWCESQGLSVGHVVDYETTVADVLALVASIGKARVVPVNGKWRPIIDRPRTAVVQIFSPRNVRSFQWHRRLARDVDGLTAVFLSEPDGWAQREVVVYRPGVSPSSAVTFDRLELAGVTSPEAARKLAQWRANELEYRKDTFEIEADVDAINCTIGDLVLIQHDSIPAGEHAARVVDVITAGGKISSIKLESPAILGAGPRYLLRVRRAGQINEIELGPVSGKTDTFTMPDNVVEGTIKPGDLAVISRKDDDLVRAIVRDIVPVNEEIVRLICVTYDERVYDDRASEAWTPRHPAWLFIPNVIGVTRGEIMAITPAGIAQGMVHAKLAAAAAGPLRLYTGIEIRWRQGDAAWRVVQAPATATTVELGIARFDEPIELAARFVGGEWPAPSLIPIDTTGALPVTIVTAWIDGDELRWVARPERYVSGFEIRYGDPGTKWDDGVRVHSGLLTSMAWRITGVPRDRPIALMIAARTVDGLVSPPATVLLRPGERTARMVALERFSHGTLGWPGALLGGTIDGDGAAFRAPDGAAFRGSDGPAFGVGLTDGVIYIFDYTPDTNIAVRDDDVLAIETFGDTGRTNIWYRRKEDASIIGRPWSNEWYFDTGFGWDTSLDTEYWLPWPERLSLAGVSTPIQIRVDAEGFLDDVQTIRYGQERTQLARVTTTGGSSEVDLPEDLRMIAAAVATAAQGGVLVHIARTDTPPSVSVRATDLSGNPTVADVDVLVVYT